ncbi:MAG: hypothetical protein E8D50_11675 [Nitrospira sp.]|nr:MAG: hypothetical protein E8D50_11675 [Nitrospira sp.]
MRQFLAMLFAMVLAWPALAHAVPGDEATHEDDHMEDVLELPRAPQRVRLGLSLAAALLDGLFEHPARAVSSSSQIVLPASSHQNATGSPRDSRPRLGRVGLANRYEVEAGAV